MAKPDDSKPIKVEDRTNGQVVRTPTNTITRKKPPPRRSWTRWFWSNVARLSVWYTILTVFFRCPSTSQSLQASSPRVCQQYFSAKAYAQPYVQPYYDTYASQYVEKARPYLNTASDRLVKPATSITLRNYQKYAAPQVSKARVYAQARWEKNALPHLRKAQESAQQAYDENLASQVLKVSEVATPYYETAKENALNARERHIIPAIAYSQPYIYKAYATVYKFGLERVIPFTHHVWTHVVIFVDGTLWPFIKKVYGDNVRPQLVMIGERIAKYQEGRKLYSAMDEVDRILEHTATSTSTELTGEISSSTTITATSSTTSEPSVSPSARPSQPPHIATDQTITDDLIKWQKKFAVAGDTGTDDLKARIEEIVAGLVRTDLGEGRGLANVLAKTSDVQLDTMKAKIKSVVSLLPAQAGSHEDAAAESEIVKAISEAGLEIKTRARAVRAWHETYKQELRQRTDLATESTLHVLDDIRDLGLQEIGMRWAWMEGVTYQHWQKYHELKRRFADWRSEVREAALGHPSLVEALEEATKVWEESMAVTETAAKELIRLKDVARWKITARDSSDNFESRAMPIVAAAASVASSVAAGIKDALIGSSQGTIESLSSVASNSVSEVRQSASAVAGDDPNPVKPFVSEASSVVVPSSVGTMESLVDQGSSSGSSVVSTVSEAIEDAGSRASSVMETSSTGSIESMASSVSDGASSAIAAGSEAADIKLSDLSNTGSSMVFSATTGPSEGVLSSGSSLLDSVSSSAPSAVDAAKASQSLLEVVNQAGEKVAEVTSSLMSEL